MSHLEWCAHEQARAKSGSGQRTAKSRCRFWPIRLAARKSGGHLKCTGGFSGERTFAAAAAAGAALRASFDIVIIAAALVGGSQTKK